MFKLKFHNDNVNTLYLWSIVEDLDDDGLSYKHVFEVNTLGKVTHTCFVNVPGTEIKMYSRDAYSGATFQAVLNKNAFINQILLISVSELPSFRKWVQEDSLTENGNKPTITQRVTRFTAQHHLQIENEPEFLLSPSFKRTFLTCDYRPEFTPVKSVDVYAHLKDSYNGLTLVFVVVYKQGCRIIEVSRFTVFDGVFHRWEVVEPHPELVWKKYERAYVTQRNTFTRTFTIPKTQEGIASKIKYLVGRYYLLGVSLGITKNQYSKDQVLEVFDRSGSTFQFVDSTTLHKVVPKV